jgi:hypothetical protein
LAPGARRRWRAVAAGQCVDHGNHLVPERSESGHLGVQLCEPATQQLLGWLACAHAGVAYGEQFGDVPQSQPEALGALDELQPIERGVVVASNA